MTRASDYGIVQLHINGLAVGTPIDMYGSNGVEPMEAIEIGTLELPSGPNTLALEILGKNPANPYEDRYYVGLNALSLMPTASAIPWLTVGVDQLSWTPVPGSMGYDVIRGDLEILLLTGDFSQAVDDCLADDRNDTSLPYTDNPPPGQADFFLVRDVCTGTFDVTAGQPQSRDDQINASALSCP